MLLAPSTLLRIVAVTSNERQATRFLQRVNVAPGLQPTVIPLNCHMPLHDIARLGTRKQTETAVLHSRHISARNERGETPVCALCVWPEPRPDRGREVAGDDRRDRGRSRNCGVTPLLAAVENGYVGIATLLVGLGADLESVTIPGTYASIGAFFNCSALTDLAIPSRVTGMG
jgi:hypothetical protein